MSSILNLNIKTIEFNIKTIEPHRAGAVPKLDVTSMAAIVRYAIKQLAELSSAAGENLPRGTAKV